MSAAEKVFSSFNKIQQVHNFIETIRSSNQDIKKIFVSSLSGSSKPLLISRLLKIDRPILILAPDIKEASELVIELTLAGLDTNAIGILEFTGEVLQQKLTEITNQKNPVVISGYELLNCTFPSAEKIKNNTTQIPVGGELQYNDIIEYLNLLNYQKEKFVEAPGDYSVRGSLVDFWSYSERGPVRLEFDGDFLESIRYFDPENQRSIEHTQSCSLAGSFSSDESANNIPDSNIFNYLKDPVVLVSSFELKKFVQNSFNPFIQKEIQEEKFNTVNESEDFPEIELDEQPQAETKSDSESEVDLNLVSPDALWIIEDELGISNERINLGLTDPPAINSNYEVLIRVLKEYADNNFEIYITSENELQSARLKDLLSDYNEELSKLIDEKKVRIITLPLKKGFVHKESKLLILSDYQIFNKPFRTKVSSAKKFKKPGSKSLAAIKRGDYVVHEDYGIGKYAGLETIAIGESKQESMKILYNDGGVVYVNLNYLSLVKKYSSNENLQPTLSTLGTSEWINTKHKAKKKIREAAKELIELYAKRKASKGFSFSADTIWQKELEASFFYEDTPDQEKVSTEVKEDMEAVHPMDRLVCGDVGFGKTEIAVRAAFKAAQEGKQTALLVPTTILAEQHFNTFKDRLSQFPVKVNALSRFQTKKEQTEIVNHLEEGRVDIVIGTHRLLSKDVKFKDLGLLIIDEEHRFGVTAKEKLRSLKVNVDTLTLTATPIPRTLNLSLLGARDLSIIATPPPNRQPIFTTVGTFDIFKIKEWILNELRRNGQVYFVHDRVQSIDKLAGYLNKYIPDIRIAIAHGQMKPAQLEEVIHGFLNKKFDVLLSTKIIESGIDIPNVNTIIVNRADRFGLAELHQLRGRVGRSDRQAYAYFIVPSLSGISKKSLRRLQAIEEFTDVGAGFNISMRDLEIRGAGNLLGMEQTGFVNDIGFDLFLKMINEAVEELKQKEFKDVFKELPATKERSQPNIDTFFNLGIPQEYMPDQMDRLNFYTSLYSVSNTEELNDIKEEMTDRFGAYPEIVKRLLLSAELRMYASYALFERVIIQRKNIFLILPKAEREEFYKTKFVALMNFIVEKYSSTIKFNQQKEVMKLVITNTFTSPEEQLQYLINLTKEIAAMYSTGRPTTL